MERGRLEDQQRALPMQTMMQEVGWATVHVGLVWIFARFVLSLALFFTRLRVVFALVPVPGGQCLQGCSRAEEAREACMLHHATCRDTT